MNNKRIIDYLDATLGDCEIRGLERNYKCPFCVDSGKYNPDSDGLHVNVVRDAAICHTCGYATRSLLYLIRDAGGTIPKRLFEFKGAVNIVKAVESVFKVDDDAEERPVKLPFDFIPLSGSSGTYSDAMRHYCSKRGIPDEVLNAYGVGFSRDDSKVGGYVVLPVYMGGVCRYWTARRVMGRGPKSWNPPHTFKSRVLYNYDNACNHKLVVVCEGPFSAMSFGTRAVGILGSFISNEQVRLLGNMPAEEFCVFLDADKKDKCVEMAHELADRVGQKVSYFRLKRGDPNDEYNRCRLNRLLRHRREADLHDALQREFDRLF